MNNEEKYRAAIELAIMQISNPYISGNEISRILKEAIKPPFEPVEGAVYAFWNDDDDGTTEIYYRVFSRKSRSGFYFDSESCYWDNYRPLTAEEKGEQMKIEMAVEKKHRCCRY